MLSSLKVGELSESRYSELVHRIRRDSFDSLTNQITIVSASNIPKQVNKAIDINSIKVTNIFERGTNKEICGLCNYYFDKSSVIFKVPNYRILAKLRKWNIKRDGKRYDYPSFIYSSSFACSFCAQLLCDSLEDEENDLLHKDSQKLKLSNPKSFHENNEIDVFESPTKTKIGFSKITLRSDLSINQKCYQSSTVDNYNANNCIIIPYEIPSKTVREADPWWELEFQDFYHIHSLHFVSINPIKQFEQDIHVFVFDKPIGFDDPFISR